MDGKKKFGTKAQILGAHDLPVEELEVPEWGFWVRVKTLMAQERDNFETEVAQRNGRDVKVNTRNLRARLVAATLVDEEGQPLFTIGDVEALGRKSAKALDRIFEKASALAGIGPKDVEQMAANFGETPAGG